MKTITMVWVFAGWCLGCCSPAMAADQSASNAPPVIQAADLMTVPTTNNPGKLPLQDRLQPPTTSSTNTLHAVSRHNLVANKGGSSQTNAGAMPAAKTDLSGTASSTSRATQNGKAAIDRKKYGGLFYDVFTTPEAYKLFNPFAPIRDDQEDNTAYDPITGKASGVALFKIHFGEK